MGQTTGRTLFIGSYTEQDYLQPGAAPGTGISAVSTDDGGLPLSVLAASRGVRNPSFLTVAGGVVYAVEELAEGAVVALDAAALTMLDRTSTGGSDPCDVLAAGPGLLAANYSSGTVAVIPARGGALEAAVQLVGHPGRGPVPDRQESSHAHQCRATDWGTILVADLGADRVDEYSVGDDGRLARLTSAQLPPGTGPRHMALQGQELLVVGELDGALHHFHRADGRWQWICAVPVFDEDNPALSVGNGVQPSHIQLTADGRRLYVGVRGRNSIAVLDVAGLVSGERPRLMTEIGCGGEHPRHFQLVEDAAQGGSHPGGRLYVANLGSDRVSVFGLGPDGLPQPEPVRQFGINSPTCVIAG